MSAIRLSSGSERACIFLITWVRCTFTVDSAMPISLAICLLRRPAVTWIMMSRSRGLSASKRFLTAGTIASKAGLDSVEEILVTERFCEEFYGTALHGLHGHRNVPVRCDEDD